MMYAGGPGDHHLPKEFFMITKKYQIFLKVARLGSISNAAKALGQTQSSVTQALHALEGELHLTLFDRSRTGVTLTAQGKALLPYVEAVEESENRLLSYAADLAAKKQTVLRIGTFTSVAVNWLPELFQKYKAVEPGIRFEMKDIGYNNIEEILREEDLDFCFVSLPLSQDIKCIPLYDDPLMAVVSKEHPWANKPSCPLTAFETEPVISLIEELNQDARSVWTTHHIHPNIQYVTKDDYAMLAMVEKGLGICIVPKLLLQDTSKEVIALPLNPPSYRTIGLAFPPGKEASQATLQFVSFIKQEIKVLES